MNALSVKIRMVLWRPSGSHRRLHRFALLTCMWLLRTGLHSRPTTLHALFRHSINTVFPCSRLSHRHVEIYRNQTLTINNRTQALDLQRSPGPRHVCSHGRVCGRKTVWLRHRNRYVCHGTNTSTPLSSPTAPAGEGPGSPQPSAMRAVSLVPRSPATKALLSVLKGVCMESRANC